MNKNAVIVFDKVSKQYHLQPQRTLKEFLPAFVRRQGEKKELWALKEVGFEIKKGETIGVIGPNGAGKSTILKLIAGVTKPTKGKLTVNGRVSPLIELGAGFHPDMSGAENIYLNGVILGLSKKQIDEKFKEIVDFAELWDFIDQPVKTYSSGMYMRLGFAVAVNAVFDILLIDEILSVGDLRFQQKCFERLREIQKAGKTIVFVTHDLSAARAFCQRVVVLEKGKIIVSGKADSAIDFYIQKQGEKENVLPGEKTSLKKEAKLLKIKKVDFVDRKGKKKTSFLSREQISIVVSYQSRKKIDDVVFGIAFYREDGTHLYGTNSLLQNKNLTVKKGLGRVKFVLKRLPILQGKILVTIAAHTREGENYDWHEKEFSFFVFNSRAGADGFIDLDAKFLG